MSEVSILILARLSGTSTFRPPSFQPRLAARRRASPASLYYAIEPLMIVRSLPGAGADTPPRQPIGSDM